MADIRGQQMSAIACRLGALADLFRRVPWPLGVALGMIVVFAFRPDWHGDLEVFREASEGLHHPYWARWLFSLLALPPELVAFVALSVACTASLYLATRVFGGQCWKVFVSFAFGWRYSTGKLTG